MKKIIAAVLALCCVVFLFAGCKNEEQPQPTKNPNLVANPDDNKFLPVNLEFGMTRENAKQIYESFPELNFSDYESFYQIDSDALYADMMDGKGLVTDPRVEFNFNACNELYELVIKTDISDGENAAEYLFNEYVDFFQLKSGVSATISETSNQLLAEIETETLRLRVVLEEDDGDFDVYAITCCKVYEMK